LWEYFEEFDYLFGAVFIILGIFLTFLGRKLFLAAVFIASLVLVTIVVLALSYGTFLSDNYSEGVFWGMLSASILIGIIVGVLLVKFSRFAAFAIGAWGGYVLGLFINDLALWAVASTWLFWLVNIGCAIVCGVLAFFFFNPAIILSTAFIGSYLILRGIGMYAGGFQNEYTIVSEIQSGTSDNILWTTYAYLAGMVVVFIIGSIVQFKTLKSMSEEEKKHPYNRLA